MSKTAFIITTSRCNKSCSYCFYKQDNFRKNSDKISLSDASKLVKDLKEFGFGEITITGGEPLLKKELSLNIAKEANKENFIVNFDTNGTLFDQEIIEDFKKINKFRIYLSSQYLDFLRDFSLRELSSIFPITIIHVVTKENLNNLRKTIEMADRHKTQLIIQPAYINQEYQNFKELSLKNLNNQEQINFENILKKWAERNKKKEYFNLICSYYAKNKSGYPNNCHMGSDDIVIDSDGSVYPCFHRQDLISGNILKEPLKDILIKTKDLSKQISNASCFGEHCLSLFY